jgi:hypothetical protein
MPKCHSCGYKNWFSIDEIKSDLFCKGCHTSFKCPVEAQWYYKLNELVKNTIMHQGVMPTILCLGQILNSSRNSFIYCPNLDPYKNERDKNEIDIICISDGQLIIGEVKNTARFTNNEILKMEEVAIKVRPDKFILYIVKEPFHRAKNLTENLEKKLKDYDIEVQFMHAPKNFNDPPYHLSPF